MAKKLTEANNDTIAESKDVSPSILEGLTRVSICAALFAKHDYSIPTGGERIECGHAVAWSQLHAAV